MSRSRRRSKTKRKAMVFAGNGGDTAVLVRPFDAAGEFAEFPRPPGCSVLGPIYRPVVYRLNPYVIMHQQQPPPPPPPGAGQRPMFLVAVGRKPAPRELSPAVVNLQQQQQQAVEVRDVWMGNLRQELSNISALLHRYPGVCVDTEFPGTVLDSGKPRHLRAPPENYAVVKSNVDGLKLLQLGLALFHPFAGGAARCPIVWQFNFRGFDEASDPHAPNSIAMLKAQGMNFTELQEKGIDAGVFACEFARSGLALWPGQPPQLTWAAFSCCYDFAYLAKVLSGGRPLPDTLEGFLSQVRCMFGPWVLDVKYIARFCGGGGGIHGGLEKVAAVLGVDRCVGRAHNAGSDSLLTADVLRMMATQFLGTGGVYAHSGKIDGLAVY